MGPHGMAEGAGEAVSMKLVRAGGISLLWALFRACNRKQGPLEGAWGEEVAEV